MSSAEDEFLYTQHVAVTLSVLYINKEWKCFVLGHQHAECVTLKAHEAVYFFLREHQSSEFSLTAAV